jgi:hypothetical protein
VSLDIVAAVLYLGPGFLALKLFYLFGAQRPRSEWEWTTWSAIASIPINLAASLIVPVFGPLSAPFTVDGVHVAVAIVIGLVGGLVAAWAWRRARASTRPFADWLRRQVTDSAWDLALDDAQHAKRAVSVVMSNGRQYRGTLGYAGREDAAASGWLYLQWPARKDPATNKYVEMTNSHGILIDRDKVVSMRVYLSASELAET